MISIVAGGYNEKKYLRSFFASVYRQTCSDISEVIYVDNGSTDGVAQMLRRDHPGIRVIRNDRNEGAARARNQGIEASRAPWVLTLDCDVVLWDNFLDEILSAVGNAAPRAGMIQAKILKDDSAAIFSTGIRLTPLRRLVDRGQGRMDKGQFNRKIEIFGPCSAAAVYRRSMLDEVKDAFGYFDERFFFLVEDVDLAWRARRAGWKAVFAPRAVCAHRGDSSRTNRHLRQFYCFRNRKWMLEKNEGPLGAVRNFLLSPFYDAPRRLYLSLSNPYFKNSSHE